MKETRTVNGCRASLWHRILGEERGQVLPIMTFFIMSIMGMGALAVDFGRAYVSFHQLQSATDAAALAGAEQLPASTASTTATSFSASSSDKNFYNWMSSVNTTVTLKCLSTLTSQGLPCIAPSSANAIRVTSTYSVPTYFARLFGISSIPIAWTSTASMNGSASTPWNIAIIVDTTASMNDTDSDSQCSTTRIACSLANVVSFLESSNIAPCTAAYQAAHGNCGSATSGSAGAANVTSPLDEIALFTFPNITESTVANDYGCAGTSPSIPSDYQFPTTSDTTYQTATSPTAPATLINPSTDTATPTTYEVVGFSSDYKTSNTSTTLSTTSNLAKAVGGVSGCKAMIAKGGLGTYYAGVIYAAQAALDQEKASSGRSLSQNAIILISDGAATEDCTKMGDTSSSCPTPATNGTYASGATSGGTYPSWNKECDQAVTAAQYAAGKGTRIYSVAYGAESTGCSAGDTYNSPCLTMENIASSSGYFFSDYTSTGSSGACISSAESTTNLTTIFQYIAGTLTASRIIPNSVT